MTERRCFGSLPSLYSWVLQGMHEVLAPFVALSDPELPTSDISLCYSAFIKRFLPYAFNKDEEFLSLQVQRFFFKLRRNCGIFAADGACVSAWGAM